MNTGSPVACGTVCRSVRPFGTPVADGDGVEPPGDADGPADPDGSAEGEGSGVGVADSDVVVGAEVVADDEADDETDDETDDEADGSPVGVGSAYPVAAKQLNATPRAVPVASAHRPIRGGRPSRTLITCRLLLIIRCPLYAPRGGAVA